MKKMTKEVFIEKAVKVHGDKYDYSHVVCNGIFNKVDIVCKKHGLFSQRLSAHIHEKMGCRKCGNDRQSVALLSSRDEFVAKAQTKFGNKYDYSKVEYLNAKSKVILCCRTHGEFNQSPNSHISGAGCPKCVYHISTPEIKWLDEQGVSSLVRQHSMFIDKKLYKVDGYDPKTNTIYEFLGDYWHGNPAVFKEEARHPLIKKTYGELYVNTMKRISTLIENGYKVNYIWEADYKAGANL